MTAPLQGPDLNFGKGRGKQPTMAKRGGRQSMQTEPDHKPRYVLVGDRQVWRPRAPGFPDMPGDRTGATS